MSINGESLDVASTLTGLRNAGHLISFEPVGSRVTCNPPPGDTDEDWLVLACSFDSAVEQLQDFGFECEGEWSSSYPEDDGFNSLRLGDINIIITDDDGFYGRFLAASSLARRFNLIDKADRIALFQAVLYGNAYEERDES